METTLNASLLAMHLIAELGQSRSVNLDTLASRLNVRRTDVRTALTRLHHEGYVDAARMRLTLSGLVIARSLRGQWLKPFRVEVARRANAA